MNLWKFKANYAHAEDRLSIRFWKTCWTQIRQYMNGTFVLRFDKLLVPPFTFFYLFNEAY